MDPRFYESYYHLEQTHWWFRARRKILLKLIRTYTSPGRIFDVGCGSGFFVRELQRRGYQASGSDAYVDAIRFGQAQGITGISIMNDGHIDSPDNSLDAVCAFDVLEHIADEGPVLREIYRVLRPGGVAFITAPAFMFLWGVQDEVSHHYRRYRLPEICVKLRSMGNVSIKYATYFNSLLFIPIAAVRFMSKLLPFRGRQSDFDIQNKILNALLYGIFAIETAIIPKLSFPFGVSIAVVIKKH